MDRVVEDQECHKTAPEDRSWVALILRIEWLATFKSALTVRVGQSLLPVQSDCIALTGGRRADHCRRVVLLTRVFSSSHTYEVTDLTLATKKNTLYLARQVLGTRPSLVRSYNR